MQKPKSKLIDKALCKRTSEAFKRLGMTYEQIAIDAVIPSKSQLIEISNGVMEPSKRILRYLCERGFSAQWLLTGKGPVLWMDRKPDVQTSRAFIKQIKKEMRALTVSLDEISARTGELKKVLALLSSR